jgi:hypothetical protein
MNLWKRETKTEQEYVISQREYLFRYLGDMHFLLQEYDTAYNYYKELVTELKSNKTKALLMSRNALEYQMYARLLMGEQGSRIERKKRDEVFEGLEEVMGMYISEK